MACEPWCKLKWGRDSWLPGKIRLGAVWARGATAFICICSVECTGCWLRWLSKASWPECSPHSLSTAAPTQGSGTVGQQRGVRQGIPAPPCPRLSPEGPGMLLISSSKFNQADENSYYFNIFTREFKVDFVPCCIFLQHEVRPL